MEPILPTTRSGRPAFLLPVVFMLLVMVETARAGWPEVPTPPGTKVEALGQIMEWNTIPMRARVFQSKLSTDRVLAFYRDRWEDGFVEDEYGPWRQISRQEGEYFITVQVQPGAERGSHGRISIMHLHERPVERPGTGVPMLQGSQVFNDLRSRDPGRRNRTTALMNRFSVESNRDFYRHHYVEQGWGVVMMRDVEGGHVAVFRKGSDEVSVVINRSGDGTTILVNEVEARGLLSW